MWKCSELWERLDFQIVEKNQSTNESFLAFRLSRSRISLSDIWAPKYHVYWNFVDYRNSFEPQRSARQFTWKNISSLKTKILRFIFHSFPPCAFESYLSQISKKTIIFFIRKLFSHYKLDFFPFGWNVRLLCLLWF